MVTVSSFDVFDTVLMRTVGDPSAVFLLLGKLALQQQLIGCSAEVFARARTDAEGRAVFNVRSGEPTIQQIYQELASGMRLSDCARDAVMRLECDLEERLIQPVPGAHERVRRARAAGNHVVFVSDMYLPKPFILRQLKGHGLSAPDERVFVSCEYGKSKRSGELFQQMIEELQVPATAVVHCGNNPESDAAGASRCGLRTALFTDANLNRYEQILECQRWHSDGLTSLMAGASRFARLNTPAVVERDKALAEVSAGVVGPVLTAYVLWILQRAQARGLRRLYFVSRDGFILKEIARRLAPKLKIDCELRYLYGSRHAWHNASLVDIGEREISWIFEQTDVLSVRIVLARVNMRPDDVAASLAEYGFASNQWDRKLNQEEIKRLRAALKSDTIAQRIIQQAAKQREMALQYFAQEGLFDGTQSAIVDVGWSGRLMDSLASIVCDRNGDVPIGLYFGMLGGSSLHHKEAYLFDRRFSSGYLALAPMLSAMMEMFCSAPHGQVIGYKGEGSRIMPILRKESNDLTIKWGLKTVHDTVFQFAEALVLDHDIVSASVDIRPVVETLIRTFWQQPTEAEARAWGQFPYVDDQAEAYWSCIAEPYRLRQAVLRAFGRPLVCRRVSWHEGALAVSSRHVRFAIKISEYGTARVRRFRKLLPIFRMPGIHARSRNCT